MKALPENWLTPAAKLGKQVIYALQPKQFEVLTRTPVYAREDGYEHVGYGGSAGSAKSHTARALALIVAMTWPASTTIIFRKTEPEVLENHYQKFRAELPEKIPNSRVPFYRWNGSDLAFTFPRFKNSRILLGHLRHDDDVFKYIGNEYDVVIFEESTMQTEFQVEYITGNRMRATTDLSIPFAFYPSNPGNVGHQWYKRRFITRDEAPEEEEDIEADLPPDGPILSETGEQLYAGRATFVQARLSDNLILEQRDPGYKKRLDRLPEPYRSWQRDGDFEAGAGASLSQLRRQVHLVKPFGIPDYWEYFGSFDWGYSHPWSYGLYVSNEDGDVFKVLTAVGSRMLPDSIAQRIKVVSGIYWERLRYIEAGRDVFEYRKARGENMKGENTPTLHEQFMEQDGRFGIMRRANVDRIQGLQNLRAYLQWDNTGPEIDGKPTAGDPGLRFFNNPGNRKAIRQLEAMVPDPDNLEDVLKVDANEFGEGGDDIYDETRYAIAGRPRRAEALEKKRPLRPFAPEVLQREMEKGRRPDDTRDKLPSRRNRMPSHPELGDYA